MARSKIKNEMLKMHYRFVFVCRKLYNSNTEIASDIIKAYSGPKKQYIGRSEVSQIIF